MRHCEPDRVNGFRLRYVFQICFASAGVTETTVMDESGRMHNANKTAQQGTISFIARWGII